MKLLASDLDGTLYFNETEPHIKPQDQAAIEAFQKAGNLFGICSGRTYAGICHALDGTGIHLDFYILVSGACLMDGQGHYIYRHLLSKDLISQIVRLVQDEKSAQILFCAQENYYLIHPNTAQKRRGKEIDDMSEAKEEQYDSLHISFSDPLTLERIKARLTQTLSEQIEIHHNVNNLDITPKGCSKGKAILTLDQYLPIQFQNIAVIGDSYNDISMLKTAPTSFTFHSSEKEVRDHAKYLVSDIAEAIQIIKEEQ